MRQLFPAPFRPPQDLDVVFLARRSGSLVTPASKLAAPFCYFPPLGPDRTALELCLPITPCQMIPKRGGTLFTVPSTWQKAAIQSVSTARVTSVQPMTGLTATMAPPFMRALTSGLCAHCPAERGQRFASIDVTGTGL